MIAGHETTAATLGFTMQQHGCKGARNTSKPNLEECKGKVGIGVKKIKQKT